MKPILKWVGGKTQILDKIFDKFPSSMNNYREIFLGGGSVLFALLSHVKAGNISVNGKIYAYDVNESLIHVYKNIQSSPIELFVILERMIHEYNSCPDAGNDEIVNRVPANLGEAKSCKESYYYWTRIKYNELAQGKIHATDPHCLSF
jgi:DNA adenine methylase